MKFIRRWARRRLTSMLPRLEAQLDDEEAKLARLNRFQEDFGGRARRILDQEKRVKRAKQRVEKARKAA